MSKIGSILEGLNSNRVISKPLEENFDDWFNTLKSDSIIIDEVNEGSVKEVILFSRAIGDLKDRQILAIVDALDKYEEKTHHIPSENDKVKVNIMGNTSYVHYVNKNIKGHLTQCVKVESIIDDKNTPYLKTYVIYPTFPGVRIKPEADTYKGSTPDEIESFITESGDTEAERLMEDLEDMLDKYDKSIKCVDCNPNIKIGVMYKLIDMKSDNAFNLMVTSKKGSTSYIDLLNNAGKAVETKFLNGFGISDYLKNAVEYIKSMR